MSSQASAPSTAPPPTTGFPPYPPYPTEPVPPTVKEIIGHGRKTQRECKSGWRKPIKRPPRIAPPRWTKVLDDQLSRRRMRDMQCCLWKHGYGLTARMEYLAKPMRRRVIDVWREHAHVLPPNTIMRLRCQTEADCPFKPDQAYQYFIRMRNQRKYDRMRCCRPNKRKVTDLNCMILDKRFQWARNATVAFARGVQKKLAKPARFTLSDMMVRLSNIVLKDVSKMIGNGRMPCRRCTNTKGKFMIEISDKIACWMQQILADAEDRQLIMDKDEDEEVQKCYCSGLSTPTKSASSSKSRISGEGSNLSAPPSSHSQKTPLENPPTPNPEPTSTKKTEQETTINKKTEQEPPNKT